MQEPNDDQGTILRWDDHIVPILEHPDIHIRDKALIAVQWELHAEPSELHQLCFNDVEDWGEFMILNISGSKRLDRGLTICGSMPYLKKWLQAHPVTELLATDAEPLEDAAPSTTVWTQTRRNEHLSSKQFLTITERARERADVTTEVTLHNIRRSRAKLLALQIGFTDPSLRERFGWTANERRNLVEQEKDTAGLGEDTKPHDPVRCLDCGSWTPPHRPCIWCGTDR